MHLSTHLSTFSLRSAFERGLHGGLRNLTATITLLDRRGR